MTNKRVLARLRIEPCGVFGSVTRTISLQQMGTDYSLEVVEREKLTKTRSCWRVPISEGDVKAQLDALKQATIPAIPISPMVCDGEYLELTVEGEFSKLTLGWWTIAPKGAACLSNFADWLRETVATGFVK